MGADITGPGSDGQDDLDAAGRGAEQYGTRPLGPRQYGTRPADPRQYGTRPARQYGTRPDDPRQYGTRPARQYGTRPARQYGTRPVRQYGTRIDVPDDQHGFIDPDEWSADIADLFCAYSAVVRLGARIVCDGSDLPLALVRFDRLGAAPNYLPPGHNKPRASVDEQTLKPRSHELAVLVDLPNQLVRDLFDHPDVAWAVKEDVANALALRADQGFLLGAGAPTPDPRGVANPPVVRQALLPPAGPTDLLETARAAITAVRRAPTLFRNAGWVLSPGALATLAGLVTEDTLAAVAPPPGPGVAIPAVGRGVRTLDDTDLLSYDGRDGGQLLGYPFFVSEAAGGPNGMFFSADWAEAWIGVDRDLVTVDVSVDTRFNMDETVVRAVMRHDFRVRRPASFRYTR